MAFDIKQEVTDRIVRAIENGKLARPSLGGRRRNNGNADQLQDETALLRGECLLFSRRQSSCPQAILIDAVQLLWIEGMERGCERQEWLTFKQAQQLGVQGRQGLPGGIFQDGGKGRRSSWGGQARMRQASKRNGLRCCARLSCSTWPTSTGCRQWPRRPAGSSRTQAPNTCCRRAAPRSSKAEPAPFTVRRPTRCTCPTVRASTMRPISITSRCMS